MKPLNNLDETEIIRIFQKNLNNKKFLSEDVEVFNVDKSKIIVKTDIQELDTLIKYVKLEVKHVKGTTSCKLQKLH